MKNSSFHLIGSKNRKSDTEPLLSKSPTVSSAGKTWRRVPCVSAKLSYSVDLQSLVGAAIEGIAAGDDSAKQKLWEAVQQLACAPVGTSLLIADYDKAVSLCNQGAKWTVHTSGVLSNHIHQVLMLSYIMHSLCVSSSGIHLWYFKSCRPDSMSCVLASYCCLRACMVSCRHSACGERSSRCI